MTYFQAVRQFVTTLKNIDAVLGKAQAYADARKFDVNNLCSARLAPDMLPLAVQVRIMCDQAKSAGANLAQVAAPVHEDNEKTVEELRARIGKCAAFLETLKAADFEKTTPKTVVKLAYPAGKAMHADDYLWSRQIPNFYFHVNMVYALLRHSGVPIGKEDYLGALPLIDA